MSYDFTADEFARLWASFNKYADPEFHVLSIAALLEALAEIVDNVNDDDITWFIRHVNAMDTGKMSFIKFVKGVGDLYDHKFPTRKKRPEIGRRFTWREIAELFRLFLSIDRDKSGEISFSELYKALRHINPRAQVNDALAMFTVLDVDRTNSIDFAEFVRGISLGNEASIDIIPGPDAVSDFPQRPMSKKERPSQISVAPEGTSEVFRSVEGMPYARDLSSAHFPKRLPPKSGAAVPQAQPEILKSPNSPEPQLRSTTAAARRHSAEIPSRSSTSPLRGSNLPDPHTARSKSRLYDQWLQKNTRPNSVLDQRIPKSSVTKPSFFPQTTSPKQPKSLPPVVESSKLLK